MNELSKQDLCRMLDMDPPINSLLENDLYKWSMAQTVLHQVPACDVRVDFRCRSGEKLGFLKPVIDHWLDHLCTLRYDDGEIAYLRSIPWLAEDFVDYLRRFYLFREQIHTDVDGEGQLLMWAEGPWRDVIWFEVPCLAIVQECWMRWRMLDWTDAQRQGLADEALRRLVDKAARFDETAHEHPFTLSDFGLRRRFGRDWHDIVVAYLSDMCHPFVGTSDVYLARKHAVKPVGTMAHEIYMGLQGCGIQLRNVQKETWERWMREYRGRNGILLSDIFGFRACLRDMDWFVANSFQGCRHDSGDPFKWGELLIAKYEELGIDPKTKVGCWSDNLDPDAAIEIAKRFSGRINVAFGIGTNLVCDTPLAPLSIVMKLTYSNGEPVLKLSDSPGKGMCPSESLVEYAKQVYHYEAL